MAKMMVIEVTETIKYSRQIEVEVSELFPYDQSTLEDRLYDLGANAHVGYANKEVSREMKVYEADLAQKAAITQPDFVIRANGHLYSALEERNLDLFDTAE